MALTLDFLETRLAAELATLGILVSPTDIAPPGTVTWGSGFVVSIDAPPTLAQMDSMLINIARAFHAVIAHPIGPLGVFVATNHTTRRQKIHFTLRSVPADAVSEP